MMLFGRWKKLMANMGLNQNKKTYEAIVSAYSEGTRRYHNLDHLRSVLDTLDLSEQLAINKNEIELALWFHDAVYNPFSTANELKSAEWAREFLIQNCVDEERMHMVMRLIRSTEHVLESSHSDDRLIADIDIAILGQPEDIYQKYARGVRYEYRKVPSCIYKRKRKILLDRFLQMSRIYSTAHFYKAFETQARKNLKNEILRLQEG